MKRKNPADLTKRNEDSLKNKIAEHHIEFKKFKRDILNELKKVKQELKTLNKK